MSMKRYCSNCFSPLPYKAEFCPHCGQKSSNGKVTMGFLLRKLWNTTFHLEGKFFRSAWQLFVPGLVTMEFFKGKQNRYPHPMRLFFITMFFFLFFFNHLMKSGGSKTKSAIYSYDTEGKVKGDTIRTDGESLYARLEHYVEMEQFASDYDSMPAEWRTPESQKMLDSFLRLYEKRHLPSFGDDRDESLRNLLDTLDINLITKQIRLASVDVVRYSPEQIIAKYGIKSSFDKMAVRQGVKSIKNPNDLVNAYIGSLTWSILAQVTAMAGILGLLYWRQRRLYVEHFLFLLHFHTGAMLAFMLALIAILLKIATAKLMVPVLLITGIMMYFAMRRYYGQGAWITFFKWLAYCLLYLFVFSVLFTLGLLVVFAVF